MKVAFDDVVVHESINDIGGFAFGCADDIVMPQKVTLVNEGVGTDTRLLAEMLKGIFELIYWFSFHPWCTICTLFLLSFRV